MAAVRMLILSLGLLCSGWSSGALAAEDFLAFSLKELLNVPSQSAYQGRGIFQSDRFPVSEDSVNFGLIVPLKTYPHYSTALIAAADLAAAEVNANGGINGRPLAIVRADNAHSPDKSVELAAKMVADYSVSAIIGPGTSDSTAAVLQQVTIVEKIPHLTHAASSSTLRQLPGIDLFWRMVASNERQVELITGQLQQLEREQRVFLLAGRDLYSDEILQGVTETLARRGHTPVGELRLSALVDMDDIDLAQEIERIQQLAPSAIVYTFRTNVNIAFLKKMNSQWRGEFPLIVAGDTIKQPDLELPEVASVAPCITYLVSSNSIPQGNRLNQTIAELLDTQVTGYDAAYVYDAVMLFAMAKNIEAQNKVAFKQALSLIANDGAPVSYQDYARSPALLRQHGRLSYSGMSGPVRFDARGDNLQAQMAIAGLDPSPLPGCRARLEPAAR